MRKNTEFRVNFESLKDGRHEFSYTVGDDFFENEEDKEFYNAGISVEVVLVKDPAVLVFDIVHSGTVELPCDRCLEELKLPVDGQNKLIVNFGEEDRGDDEMVITVSPSDHELDLAPFIRDYIFLSIPWKRECAMLGRACNPAMLEKIEALMAANNKKEETDPRWDALRKLK